MKPLPPSLQRRSDLDALRDDIAPYLHTTVEERSAILSQLCRWAADQMMAHPRGTELLQFQEPRPPESEVLWLRLVSQAAHR